MVAVGNPPMLFILPSLGMMCSTIEEACFGCEWLYPSACWRSLDPLRSGVHAHPWTLEVATLRGPLSGACSRTACGTGPSLTRGGVKTRVQMGIVFPGPVEFERSCEHSPRHSRFGG